MRLTVIATMIVECPRTPHPGVAWETSYNNHKIIAFDVMLVRRLKAHLVVDLVLVKL